MPTYPTLSQIAVLSREKIMKIMKLSVIIGDIILHRIYLIIIAVPATFSREAGQDIQRFLGVRCTRGRAIYQEVEWNTVGDRTDLPVAHSVNSLTFNSRE